MVSLILYIILYPLHAYDSYQARKVQARRDAFVRAQDEAMGMYADPRLVSVTYITRPMSLSERMWRVASRENIEEVLGEVERKASAA